MKKYLFLSPILIFLLLLMFRSNKPVASEAQIEIEAPLARVWNIQTDFQNWENWNSDIQSMELSGNIGVGTKFVWKAGGVTIRSQITEFAPMSKIAWRGRTVGIHALHEWDFSESNGVVVVKTRESFTGWLAWLLPGTMRNQICKALQHGIYALKAEAEGKDEPKK